MWIPIVFHLWFTKKYKFSTKIMILEVKWTKDNFIQLICSQQPWNKKFDNRLITCSIITSLSLPFRTGCYGTYVEKYYLGIQERLNFLDNVSLICKWCLKLSKDHPLMLSSTYKGKSTNGWGEKLRSWWLIKKNINGKKDLKLIESRRDIMIRDQWYKKEKMRSI